MKLETRVVGDYITMVMNLPHSESRGQFWHGNPAMSGARLSNNEGIPGGLLDLSHFGSVLNLPGAGTVPVQTPSSSSLLLLQVLKSF